MQAVTTRYLAPKPNAVTTVRWVGCPGVLPEAAAVHPHPWHLRAGGGAVRDDIKQLFNTFASNAP
jgi:hypothetical protein